MATVLHLNGHQMANYKESSLPCTSFVRACSVSCINPRNGSKMIQFQEETVIQLPDGSESFSRAGECTQMFTSENATTPFPLRDPHTGDVIGETMTYQDAYRVLMSLYYHVATERDINLGV